MHCVCFIQLDLSFKIKVGFYLANYLLTKTSVSKYLCNHQNLNVLKTTVVLTRSYVFLKFKPWGGNRIIWKQTKKLLVRNQLQHAWFDLVRSIFLSSPDSADAVGCFSWLHWRMRPEKPSSRIFCLAARQT